MRPTPQIRRLRQSQTSDTRRGAAHALIAAMLIVFGITVAFSIDFAYIHLSAQNSAAPPILQPKRGLKTSLVPEIQTRPLLLQCNSQVSTKSVDATSRFDPQMSSSVRLLPALKDAGLFSPEIGRAHV